MINQYLESANDTKNFYEQLINNGELKQKEIQQHRNSLEEDLEDSWQMTKSSAEKI
jgi:hypothetical protein